MFILQPYVIWRHCVLYMQAKDGYQSLTGVDYCSYAVELAKCIACDEQLDIQYQVRKSM